MRYDGVERTGEETGGDESIASATVSGTHSVASPASGESSEVYLERVRAALVELDRARLDKIVLARCVHRPGSVDPVATLSRMASTESGGTLYWIALDENEGFLGLTPETLYRRRGVRVETEALAGTSGPRDVDGLALLRDAKSLREHAYVRDAIVQALTPIAAELDVAADPVLHRMARLHHLRTPITATLREAQPLLSRLHPTPAVCGTPHAAAEQAIARLEAKDRGFYAGAIGWCRRDGESIHVALRGARYSRGGCLAHLGAGIVRGSVPEAELRELELKAEALFESFAAVGNEATA
ncbi:MAG: chorismate-binding protein [bacterium]|nr:chorismate-binding protein [bacterium]